MTRRAEQSSEVLSDQPQVLGSGFLSDVRAKVGSMAMFLATSVGPMALSACEEDPKPPISDKEGYAKLRQVEKTEASFGGVIATPENVTTVIVLPKQETIDVDLLVDVRDTRKDSGNEGRNFSLTSPLMENGDFLTPGQMAPNAAVNVVDAGDYYSISVSLPMGLDGHVKDGDFEVDVTLYVGNEVRDTQTGIPVQCDGTRSEDLREVPVPPKE